MSAYYFSLHMIVAMATPKETPIKEWLRRRTLLADLANEENQ